MRKHGKTREKGTNFATGNLEESLTCSATLRVVACSEERGRKRVRDRGAWAAPGKKSCVRSDIKQKN